MFEVLKKYPLLESAYVLVIGFLLLLFSLGNYVLLILFAFFVGLLFLLHTPLLFALILSAILIILLVIGINTNNTSSGGDKPKTYKQKIKSLDLME